MNSGIIILIVIVVIASLLVFYKFQHRTKLHKNTDQLKAIISKIYDEVGKPSVSQNRLIKGLKQHLGVNEKMALRLIGEARREEFIELEDLNAEKIGKSTYIKKF